MFIERRTDVSRKIYVFHVFHLAVKLQMMLKMKILLLQTGVRLITAETSGRDLSADFWIARVIGNHPAYRFTRRSFEIVSRYARRYVEREHCFDTEERARSLWLLTTSFIAGSRVKPRIIPGFSFPSPPFFSFSFLSPHTFPRCREFRCNQRGAVRKKRTGALYLTRCQS